MFANLDMNEYKVRRLSKRFGSVLLAMALAGCSTGSHHTQPKSTTPTHLTLPPASGPVLPFIGKAFNAQGVEAGRDISLSDYFSPPPDTTNVYILLEVKGTFTNGARTTPAPMGAFFGFRAPECAEKGKNTACSSADLPTIGGQVFLTKEQATNDPGAFFKRPEDSPSPPELLPGVPYYTLVAASFPSTVTLNHVSFCNDKKCLKLSELPAGSLA